MNKEITPKELFEDLNYFQSLKDARLLILFLHLYTEHFINEISKEKRIKKPNIKEKAKELSAKGVIDKELVDIVDLIYDLRNQLVHNLRPDQKLLERWIEDFKPTINLSREDGEDVFSKAINSTNAWGKIQIYTIPAIVNLFKKLREIQKRELDYDIQLEITPTFNWGLRLLKKAEVKE